MHYRNLGRSNLKVSALCLGTMMFGDQTALPEAERIVADAHAHGVNFIDTADVYTAGASEQMVASTQSCRCGWTSRPTICSDAPAVYTDRKSVV